MHGTTKHAKTGILPTVKHGFMIHVFQLLWWNMLTAVGCH